MSMMLLRRYAAFSLALAAACGPTPGPPVLSGVEADPVIPPRLSARFPAAWPHPAGGTAPFARNVMVASNDRLASEAGVEILRAGGNAMDAAVAVGFALAVTHPEAGNLGGGGYMVIRMADGRTAAIDYREVAPLAATRDMYLDAEGHLTDRSRIGHLASGVPGAVAGMAEALAHYGTMPLAQVIAPAIRLAEGFAVDSNLHRSLRGNRSRIERFAGGEVFFVGGEPLPVGSTLRQPELARTLRQIARDGVEAFYRGETARLLVAEMARGGGLITMEDLDRYRPIWREPIRGSFRGYTLLAMPPSSSGGVTMTQALNILEALPEAGAFGSAGYLHRLGSAYQRAFIDRNAKIGDPDFVDVPVAELTSKAYARRQAAEIPPSRARPTQELPGAMREGSHTTHYSVVDAWGNAVATTTTINGLYGSGVYIPGAGFFMNNEMDDFAAQPGQPNMFGLVQGEQNAIAPGKRMLSAMSPTIVLDSAERVLLVVGGRGGPRIITSTSQVILNVLEHRMSLWDAMSAPRIHHQALPDSLRYEEDGFSPEVVEALRAMGHAPVAGNATGSTVAIMRVKGGWEAMVDPRSYGGTAGY